MTLTYFGDGAMNIGAVCETLNLAALWQLPLLMFVENNGYAVSTTLAEETRETRLSSRGPAYGMPACASTAWTRWRCGWPPRARSRLRAPATARR